MKLICQSFGLFLLCFVSNCKHKVKESKITHIEQFPTIIDTFKVKVTERKAFELATANYPPLYIGKDADTIYINYFEPPLPLGVDTTIQTLRSKINPSENYSLDWETPKKLEYWEIAKIEIKIDTTQIIKNIGHEYFKAYPVMLKNYGKDTAYIGHETNIALIVEAKNKKGNWQAIEKHDMYGCGVGLRTIFLPSKYIAITSVSIYHGDFKTDLRLRIWNNYSKSFKGNINIQQFEEKNIN